MITEIDDETALVLIDLQKGIVSMPVVHSAETVIEKAVDLIKAFQARNLPVVIVSVNPLGAKWTQTRVEMPMAPKGEEAIEQARIAMEQSGFFDIVPQIQPALKDLMLVKSSWNAFFETNLHQHLQKQGITGIVLAGIATSVGVEGTARAAHEHGYHIAFATDAMTDTNISAHENSIGMIFPKLGEVGNTATIIDMLSKKA